MAARSHRQLVSICVILILALQAWSSTAYNNQQSKWLSKRLSDGPSGGASRPRVDRHLQESTTKNGFSKNGFRASLVNEDHEFHNLNDFSSMERIRHGAQKSRARASNLDSKARAAPYYGSGLRRKVLQAAADPPSYESEVEPTPGSYSMAFTIGTPPQNFIAIADTGSDLVWIQCAPCSQCFNQSSPLFQPTTSTTYRAVGCSDCSVLGSNEVSCTSKCQYTYSYGDQSITSGDYSQDTVTLDAFNKTATTTIPNFKFGCGFQNNGTFTDTDGIVGLARGPISFPSQIAPLLDNATKFSYCLADSDSNATSPIIFGEDAVPTNATGVTYTPILSPYNVSVVPYYYVNLQGISVGGSLLSIPASDFQIDANGNGGTIFDSGTTYTLLATEAFNAVVSAYTEQLSYPLVDLSQETGLGLCFDISGESAVSIPSLTFNFENSDFDLPFGNIMVLFSDTSSTYMCLALMGQSGINIFGNTQQENFQVVYEADALRLGWLPADCSIL